MLFRKKKKKDPVPVFDKSNPDYWRAIPIGSTVSLTDEAALAEAMRIGGGVTGLDYQVRIAEKVRDIDGFGEWWFYFIEGHKTDDLWLMVKIVDGDIIPIVYFEVEEFPPTLRRQLLADGQTWLFEAHKDDGEPYAPVFCNEIFQTVEDEDGEEIEAQYRCKPQGTVYGNYSRVPEEKGLSDVFIAFAEYEADESFEDPEMLVIERGGENDLNGGMVTLHVGGITVFNDIEVLRVNT